MEIRKKFMNTTLILYHQQIIAQASPISDSCPRAPCSVVVSRGFLSKSIVHLRSVEFCNLRSGATQPRTPSSFAAGTRFAVAGQILRQISNPSAQISDPPSIYAAHIRSPAAALRTHLIGSRFELTDRIGLFKPVG
ncbi:unnamed protein product [Citrullus colocynthis]|uniref:Uncharacterized protein n=1 Tax=Citrullus colocynthis TaxID=252529 RepID=A0ABP0Z2Y2_9ROSI